MQKHGDGDAARQRRHRVLCFCARVLRSFKAPSYHLRRARLSHRGKEEKTKTPNTKRQVRPARRTQVRTSAVRHRSPGSVHINAQRASVERGTRPSPPRLARETSSRPPPCTARRPAPWQRRSSSSSTDCSLSTHVRLSCEEKATGTGTKHRSGNVHTSYSTPTHATCP
ncbi:hypothetical protein DFH06DRAFT_1175048 [Mycena polygramma]|nr:hypothetical protein DFH06DRAFT_1175048 [Mycena polygramma]